MNKRNILIILLLVCIFGFVAYKVLLKPQVKRSTVVPPPAVKTVPTLTTEEVKIASEVKTGEVLISADEVKPQSIEVKLHDQVKFVNKTDKTISVKSNGWGGVPIGSGENMYNTFDSSGTFPYVVSEFNSTNGSSAIQLTGEVIVK